MPLRVHEIRALGDDRYEVTFEGEGGATERVVCRVFKHKGVAGIRMEPDIVMTKHPPQINSREVAAAVLAYHRRQLQSPRHEQQS